ncbi:membrane hypothetical protein [Brevibacillus sp. IT-7CA2]|uniref:hypothetical protein n=1 Tax=Brevibacillus sp. IT-7CA2 TaxID=3026436 RepID=UPI0039E1A8C6
MDYTKVATPVLTKIFDLLDMDITEIEKIENQYKLSRKRTAIIWLILLSIFSLICGISFYLYQMLGSTVASIVGLVVMLIPIISIMKFCSKETEKEYVPFFISLLGVFVVSLQLITLYYLEFKLVYFFIAVILFFGLSIMYMAIFNLLRSKILYKQDHKFQFVLVNGEILDVKLLSITKYDDYIVEVLNNYNFKNFQIKINRLEIQQIRYQKTDNETKNSDNQDTCM